MSESLRSESLNITFWENIWAPAIEFFFFENFWIRFKSMWNTFSVCLCCFIESTTETISLPLHSVSHVLNFCNFRDMGLKIVTYAHGQVSIYFFFILFYFTHTEFFSFGCMSCFFQMAHAQFPNSRHVTVSGVLTGYFTHIFLCESYSDFHWSTGKFVFDYLDMGDIWSLEIISFSFFSNTGHSRIFLWICTPYIIYSCTQYFLSLSLPLFLCPSFDTNDRARWLYGRRCSFPWFTAQLTFASWALRLRCSIKPTLFPWYTAGCNTNACTSLPLCLSWIILWPYYVQIK